MKPAIAYAAKSTEDKHGSIPTQLEEGRKLAQARGLEVVDELKDEAASAYHGDRGPGLAKAMRECERLSAEHGSCALIVQHSDRLARGDAKQARHLIEIVVWAIKANVDLLSVQDPEILAGGDMALLLGAVGGMRNHQDSKRKGLAVKAGHKRRAVERKQFVGGRRPYGYRYRDTHEDGTTHGPLVIVEPEAAILRRVFAEYVAGRAQNAIARDLEHEGVPTLTPAGHWYATTVAGMLKNPLYIGKITLNGDTYDGSHEPIINPETWERACELREVRAAQGRPRGRRTAGQHLLTEGLLRCTCGAAMSPVTRRDTRGPNRKVYETYMCVKRLHHGPSACDQKPIKRAAVDVAIYDYFETVALDLNSTRALITQQAQQQIADSASLRTQAEREAQKAEAALARIEGDYVDGKISAEAWSRLETRLRDDLEAARAQMEQHDRQAQAVSAQIAAIDTEAVLVEELTGLRQQITDEIRAGKSADLDEVRALLRRLFVGFELASPAVPYGSGVLGGQPWVASDRDQRLSSIPGYWLIPYLRPPSVDVIDDDFADGFPAVQRLPLFSDNLSSFLAAW